MDATRQIHYYRSPDAGWELVVEGGDSVCYPEHTHLASTVWVMVLAGSMQAVVDGASYDCRAGQCLMIRPHTPHGLAASGGYLLATACLRSGAEDGLGDDALALALAALADPSAAEASLAAIAEQAHMSKRHLIRRCKSAYGLPPHRLSLQAKVRAAQRLLEAGCPAAEAASRSGFYDQSHLTRHLKKACGLTPAEYAKAVTLL